MYVHTVNNTVIVHKHNYTANCTDEAKFNNLFSLEAIIDSN